jgi:hypothetical protein
MFFQSGLGKTFWFYKSRLFKMFIYSQVISCENSYFYEKFIMAKYHINRRLEFLQKLVAAAEAAGFYPLAETDRNNAVFENLSQWTAGWK